MTSPRAETSRRSPPGSGSTDSNQTSARGNGSRLPFAFARDHQVALDGSTLIAGPDATSTGLREARRRAGGAVDLRSETQVAFEASLARLYQTGGEPGWATICSLISKIRGNSQGRAASATCWRIPKTPP